MQKQSALLRRYNFTIKSNQISPRNHNGEVFISEVLQTIRVNIIYIGSFNAIYIVYILYEKTLFFVK